MGVLGNNIHILTKEPSRQGQKSPYQSSSQKGGAQNYMWITKPAYQPAKFIQLKTAATLDKLLLQW